MLVGVKFYCVRRAYMWKGLMGSYESHTHKTHAEGMARAKAVTPSSPSQKMCGGNGSEGIRGFSDSIVWDVEGQVFSGFLLHRPPL